jgi:molybdopterin synthase catalytic subunit/molybdopterin synthase sulfur carrier subunit
VIKMLAFAGARDVLGTGELDLEIRSLTAGELLDEVCDRFPKLAPYRRSIRLAVNGTYATASDPVGPGDEIALIPPVAGG